MADNKKESKSKKDKDALTVEKVMKDFRASYRAKKKLLEKEHDDFRFALGEQWAEEDQEKLKKIGMKPIVDNRIAPNIFLLTGLERQNRTDFKAFPEGEEDSVKSDIASALFKNAIKVSEFPYKSSDQFKDGITCGESHLEMYLDNTESLINGTPCWRKLDGGNVFPEPGFSEYDFNDCRYVNKWTPNLSKEDLINLFPDKESDIEDVGSGRINLDMDEAFGSHTQKRDYPKNGEPGDSEDDCKEGFDLIQRYYKKWVKTTFLGDKQTGTIVESQDEDTAKSFISDYQGQIQADKEAYDNATVQAEAMQAAGQPGQAPPPPPERDPERFLTIKRLVPEIWCFSMVPGMDDPLEDKRAWFYPKWKRYPFITYFARFSTAPLKGDESHLLVQGVVRGVKGVQEKHNKAEMLMLRHLNTTANSGWLAEEGSWTDEAKVEQFGTTPGINLYYKSGKQMPQRIQPVTLSNGHAVIAAESAEAIKAQLGINADLLASQEGGADSGRAIALRQRQGLLMVQELYDNLSRTRFNAGKFLLSQLGEIYDTETAKKVLGDAFLQENFPPPLEIVGDPQTGQPMIDPNTGQPAQRPITDPKTGQPMKYDDQMAEIAIAEVLAGDLGKYDVAVGEAVSSETQKMANSAEVKDIAQAYPGLIPPDVLVEESMLPQSTKSKIIRSIQQAQAAQQAMLAHGVSAPPRKPADAGAAA